MKKIIMWVFIFIAVIIAGFFVGRYLYDSEKSENNVANNVNEMNFNSIKNSTNDVEIETNASEEKITLNTKIIEEVYYIQCDHLVKEKIDNIEAYINLTKEEFEKKHPEYEIKEFSPEKVVIYREEDNFCNEHFLVKDFDGYLTIYSLDNQDNVMEIIDITEIETNYLPEPDREALINGIKVYTKEKLNKLIEDYE